MLMLDYVKIPELKSNYIAKKYFFVEKGMTVNPHIRLSLVQLLWSEGTITLRKLYIELNPNTEIVFDKNYDLTNINTLLNDGTVLIHNADMEPVGSYTIDRIGYQHLLNKAIIVKHDGTEYFPAYMKSEVGKIEKARVDGLKIGKLGGYCLKESGDVGLYYFVNNIIRTR